MGSMKAWYSLKEGFEYWPEATIQMTTANEGPRHAPKVKLDPACARASTAANTIFFPNPSASTATRAFLSTSAPSTRLSTRTHSPPIQTRVSTERQSTGSSGWARDGEEVPVIVSPPFPTSHPILTTSTAARHVCPPARGALGPQPAVAGPAVRRQHHQKLRRRAAELGMGQPETGLLAHGARRADGRRQR